MNGILDKLNKVTEDVAALVEVIALSMGGYSRHIYPTDEGVVLFGWGRFVTTVSHDGRLSWLGFGPYAKSWQKHRRAWGQASKQSKYDVWAGPLIQVCVVA